MTAKRFIVYDDGFSKHIKDTYYTEDKHEHNLYDIWEMCRKVNELYEENEDLKSFNKDLAENLSVCANARISKDNRIEKLSEENGQLKKELDQFYLLIGRGDWSGLVDLIKGDFE